MSKNNPALPEEYTIFQQDLSKRDVQLNFMGNVRTIEEAKNMLSVFYQCDKDAVSEGKHSYFYICTKIQNE